MQQELTEAVVNDFLTEWYDAYARQDIDYLVENDYGFEDGFGFRTLLPRHPLPKEDCRAALEAFFGEMESYEIGIEDIQIKIVGGVALAWGYQTESFRRKGSEPESYRVRSSFTLRMKNEGEIEILLAHRDIQVFEDAYYVPRYT